MAGRAANSYVRQPMDNPAEAPLHRRRFVAFLAASPLLFATGIDGDLLRRLFSGSAKDQAAGLTLAQRAAETVLGMQPGPISAASQALSVLDFEPVAKAKLPIGHWGYLATGTDDDGTIQANRDAYARFDLRPRRLVDVTRVDTSVTMIGTKLNTPIVINPLASQKAFHPEGEIAVARAAKVGGHLQVLSTVATASIEDVTAARGAPIWFQLYHQQDWNQTLQIVKRAERAGCPAIVFTVDLLGGSNRETMIRLGRQDTRDCAQCHLGGAPMPGLSGRVNELRDNRRKPMIADLIAAPPRPETTIPTWEFVRRLRDSTTMKVFIKGIVTKEDADLAMQHGMAGVFVSNHGGRSENSTRGSLLCVKEVTEGLRGRGVAILDGGIRRGTDIFKGLALGATAVGIGRPYIWGLASFGQEGVETVLALLRKELEMTMRQCGTPTISAITSQYVVPHGT
jgi:4-hydroxymandelate oxidase